MTAEWQLSGQIHVMIQQHWVFYIQICYDFGGKNEMNAYIFTYGIS